MIAAIDSGVEITLAAPPNHCRGVTMCGQVRWENHYCVYPSNGINIIVNQQISSAQADTASGNTGCLTLVCWENGNLKTLTKKLTKHTFWTFEVKTVTWRHGRLVCQNMCSWWWPSADMQWIRAYNTITGQHILDTCMPLLCKSFMLVLEQSAAPGPVTTHHKDPLYGNCSSFPHPLFALFLQQLFSTTTSIINTIQTFLAIIRSPCNLKFFFAEIPQGPFETSPGTIGIIQKRFQGPPARGFWIF